MNSEAKENNNNQVESKDEQIKDSDKKQKNVDGTDVAKILEGSEEAEIFDQLPTKLKEVTRVMAMSGFSGSFPSNITTKLSESNIDKIIEVAEKGDERNFKDIQRSRVFSLIYALIAVAVFIFITLYLQGKDPALFKDIVKMIVGIIGGIGIGYGYKSHKMKE